MIYQGNKEIKEVYWKGGVPTWFYRVYRVFPVIYRIKLGNPVIILDNGEWNDSYAADISYNDSIDVAKINVRSGSQEVFIFNVSAVTDSGELIDGVNWGVDTVWNYPDLTVCDWLWAEKVYTKVHGKNNNYWTIHISAGTNTNAEVRSGDTNIRIFLEGTQGWDGVSDAGKIYGKVRLIQEPALTRIIINPTGRTFDSAGTAGNNSFSYSINLLEPHVVPSVSSSYNWIHVGTPSSAGCSYTVDARHADDDASTNPWADRNGSVVVNYSGRSKSHYVYQSAATAYLNISKSSIQNIPKTGGTGTFSANTNLGDDYWSVGVREPSSHSWLTVDKTGKTIGWTATTNDNANYDDRSAVIDVSAVEYGKWAGISCACSVTQKYGGYMTIMSGSSYITGWTYNPNGQHTMCGSTTEITVSVKSKYNGENYQPYVASTTNFNLKRSNYSGITNDIYYFTFSGSTNPSTTYDRDIIIRFVQWGQESDVAYADLTITQAPIVAYITISNWRKYATAARTVSSFTVSSNVDWTPYVSYVSGEEGWLTASKTNNSKVSYTADSNTSVVQRTGRVYASYGNVSDYGEIYQDAAEATLSLTPSLSNVTLSYAQSSGTITISTNAPDYITVSKNGSWITTGLTGTTLKWTASTNSDSSTRSGSITIEAGYQANVASKTINITQRCEPGLSITASTPTPISSAQTYFSASVYTYGTDGDYSTPVATVESGPSLSITSSYSYSNKTAKFVFNCNANPNDSYRSYYISIVNEDGAGTSYNMTQNPKAIIPTISIESGILSIPATGKTGTTSVTANTTSWTAESNQSWLRVTAQTGSSNVKYSAGTNTDSSERTATITVRNGSASASRSVSQAAPPQPYVFHLVKYGSSDYETGTSMTYNIDSAVTTVQIAVVSYSGSTAILSITSGAGSYYTVTGVTTNTYSMGETTPAMSFELKFGANNSTTQRSTNITFNQTPSNKSITATVIQAPMYQEQAPDTINVLSSFTYNNETWYMGYISPATSNNYSGAVVVVKNNPVTASTNINAFVEYQCNSNYSAVNRTLSTIYTYENPVNGYYAQGYLSVPVNSTFQFGTAEGVQTFNGAILAKGQYLMPNYGCDVWRFNRA